MSPTNLIGRLSQSVFFLFWFALFASLNFKILPLVDNSAFPLSSIGQLPYRDYYFPVTPGTYFLAQISMLSDVADVIARYRFIGLMFVLMLLWSCYSICRKFLSIPLSLLISGFSFSIFFDFGLEFFGGWNLIPLTLYLSGLALLLKSSPWESSETRSSIPAINNASLFFAGSFFSMAAIFKQTFLLQFVLQVIFWISILLLVLGRKNSLKNVANANTAKFFAGYLLPLFLVYYWLSSNNLVDSFVQNMLSFGGKNPSASNIFKMSLTGFGSNLTQFLPFIFLCFMFLVCSNFIWGRHPEFSAIALAVTAPLLIHEHYWKWLSEEQKILVCCTYIVIVATNLILILRKQITHFRKPIVTSWIALIVLNHVLVSNKEPEVFAKVVSFSYPESFFVGMTLLLAVAVAYLQLQAGLKLRTIQNRNRHQVKLGAANLSDDQLGDIPMNLFFLAGMFASFINVASSGGTIYLITLISSLIYFIGYTVKILGVQNDLNAKVVLVFVFLTAMISNVAHGVKDPYVWWGWHEPSLAINSTSSEINAFVGLQPAPAVDSFYTNIQRHVLSAASQAEVEKPLLLTLGPIPMVNSVSDLEHYEKLYCKVQWFDVCPDSILLSDLNTIKEDPPDVVVFAEISEAAFQVHESAYLNAPSSLRKYQDYRNEQVSNGKWVEIGRDKTPGTQLELSNGNGAWDVVVYRVVDIKVP